MLQISPDLSTVSPYDHLGPRTRRDKVSMPSSVYLQIARRCLLSRKPYLRVTLCTPVFLTGGALWDDLCDDLGGFRFSHLQLVFLWGVITLKLPCLHPLFSNHGAWWVSLSQTAICQLESWLFSASTPLDSHRCNHPNWAFNQAYIIDCHSAINLRNTGAEMLY